MYTSFPWDYAPNALTGIEEDMYRSGIHISYIVNVYIATRRFILVVKKQI
jgi:hypothetical protein